MVVKMGRHANDLVLVCEQNGDQIWENHEQKHEHHEHIHLKCSHDLHDFSKLEMLKGQVVDDIKLMQD